MKMKMSSRNGEASMQTGACLILSSGLLFAMAFHILGLGPGLGLDMGVFSIFHGNTNDYNDSDLDSDSDPSSSTSTSRIGILLVHVAQYMDMEGTSTLPLEVLIPLAIVPYMVFCIVRHVSLELYLSN